MFAVIGIVLAGIAAIGVNLLDRAKDNKAKTELQVINTAVSSFYSDTSHYPTTLQDLIRKPQGDDFGGWDGPYLPKGKMPDKTFNYKRTEDGEHGYELTVKTSKGNILSVWKL